MAVRLDKGEVLHPRTSLFPLLPVQRALTHEASSDQVLHWLPRYNVKQFGGDVTAALTLTSMIVPQSMSYSTNLVHSDPVYGLFAAAIPAMLYSVLGTCRQLSVGPEAALSLITGELIARFVEDEEHAHGRMGLKEKAELTVLLTTILTFQAGLVTFMYAPSPLLPVLSAHLVLSPTGSVSSASVSSTPFYHEYVVFPPSPLPLLTFTPHRPFFAVL